MVVYELIPEIFGNMEISFKWLNGQKEVGGGDPNDRLLQQKSKKRNRNREERMSNENQLDERERKEEIRNPLLTVSIHV